MEENLLINDPLEARRRTLRTIAGRVGFSLVLFILLNVFLSIPVTLGLAYLGFPIKIDYLTMQIYGDAWALQVCNLVNFLLAVGIPILYLLFSFRGYVRLRSVWKPTPAKILFPSIPMVLGLSAVSIFVCALIQSALGFFGVSILNPSYHLYLEPLPMLLQIIHLVILPAVLEETLFHGFIMQGLRCYSDGVALLVTTLLFGLSHGTIVQSANGILVGLFIGYLVLRTGSVWTGVVLHGCVNAIAYLDMLFYQILPETTAFVVATIGDVLFILLGLLLFFRLVRKEKTAFSIPLPTFSGLSSKDLLTTCLTSGGMLLSLAVLVCYHVYIGG